MNPSPSSQAPWWSHLNRYHWFVLIVAALAGGCQSRLKFDQTSSIEMGEVKYFEVDSPKYEQKVSVDITSEHEISVYIVGANEKDAVYNDLNSSKEPKNVLAAKEQFKSGSVEATVPAREKFYVFLAKAKKKGNVTIKLVGK